MIPDQQDKTDLAVDVEASASQNKREDGARKSERNRRHHDDRADETLELRGENKQDNRDRGNRRSKEARSRFR